MSNQQEVTSSIRKNNNALISVAVVLLITASTAMGYQATSTFGHTSNYCAQKHSRRGQGHTIMNHNKTPLQLQYRNGDAEEDEPRKRAHKNVFSRLRWPPGKGSEINSPSNELSKPSQQESTEQYDLEVYLEYVNRRYERLHHDDTPQGHNSKYQKQLSKASASTNSDNAGGWQHFFNVNAGKSKAPTAQQHFDAMYALSWAGHFAEQIHNHASNPWSDAAMNEDAVDVSVSEAQEDDVVPEKGSLAKNRAVIAVDRNLDQVTLALTKLHMMRSSYLSAQRRAIFSLFRKLVKRVGQVMQATIMRMSLVGQKRIKSLYAIICIFIVQMCIKPMIVEASSLLKSTKV